MDLALKNQKTEWLKHLPLCSGWGFRYTWLIEWSGYKLLSFLFWLIINGLNSGGHLTTLVIQLP